jgi:hypothetical protein
MNEAILRALIDASPSPMIVLDGALRVTREGP